jgi:HD-GYP domain-containing protein (c-di-GMP phosphodiesterase class II)
VIDADPALSMPLSPAQSDAALRALASFVDMKSPYTLGRSLAVAELASKAAEWLGMDAEEVRVLYRAGLVHGFGRLGVSNAIWDKHGPLAAGQWERVRSYPYLTERMVHQSDSLAPIGRVAAQVQERLDGSGYPKGLRGAAIAQSGRVLAAAAAYQAMREPRPHRAAMTSGEAAGALRHDVRAGGLDADAVEAVLGAAGLRAVRRRDGPAGLTAREVEVLRLLVRGLTAKEIAERLVISAKTATNHIEHIYTKIQVSNRAAASLYALQHGLLPDEDFAD